MTRTELFREKRNRIAKTEYFLVERLYDLSERIEALTERVDRMSEHLYFFAKTDREELKNAFDEQFKESLKEYEKWIGGLNNGTFNSIKHCYGRRDYCKTGRG